MALPIENRQIAYYTSCALTTLITYGIFCNARVLNSLHFLNGASAGFLPTLAASRPPRYATTRGPYRRDHSPAGGRILRGRRSLGPTALSASSISRLGLCLDLGNGAASVTARWEPEAPQAPHLARATSIAASWRDGYQAEPQGARGSDASAR